MTTSTTFLARYKGHRWTREETERVTRNLGLVGMVIAKCRWCSHLERQEREAIGREALVRAALAFDPARGFKFSTYAYWAIRRALKDQHYADRPIRLPRCADRLKTDECREAMARIFGVSSLGAIDDGESIAALGVMDDGDEEDEAVDLANRLAEVRRASMSLSERDRLILRAKSEGRTLRSIGNELGVTKERVRQLHDQAVDRLRVHFGLAPRHPRKRKAVV